MSSPADKLRGWIDTTAQVFQLRLGNWFANVLSFGFDVFFKLLGKSAAPKFKPLIDKLEATGKIPPELKPLFDELKNPTGEVSAMLANSAGSALVGGAIGKILDAILLPMAYSLHSATQNVILSEGQHLALWLRGYINDSQLSELLGGSGLSDERVDALKDLTQVRLDANTWVTALRRKYENFAEIANDLKDSGWSESRIGAMKEATKAYPALADVVMFYAKEAFEPDMIERYGLLDELPPYDGTLFEKLGVPKEIADLYWAAHWQPPAFREVTDLLHRGEITEADVFEWYRLVEIPPYWRDKLTSISWDLPNRIELRMMARYGLVDKPFLVDVLGKVGLKEEYRSIAADMMLAMGVRTDVATRYSKGWITSAEVMSELIGSGLAPEVAERMNMWIVKNVSTERVVKERDLTVTDIIKGVKKGTITREEGKVLLQEMGYDADEAQFKLDINVPVEEEAGVIKERELTKADILKAYKLGQIDRPEAISRLVSIRYKPEDADLLLRLIDVTTVPISEIKLRDLTKGDIIKGVKAGIIAQTEGYEMLLSIGYDGKDAEFILSVNPVVEAGSPDTYNEFLAMTQQYRKAQKLSTKTVSSEMIQAERDVKATQAALKTAKEANATQERIRELELLFEQAKQLYHQLITQAQSES